MIRTRRVLASAFIAAATLPVAAGIAQATPAEEPQATDNTTQEQTQTPQFAADSTTDNALGLLAMLAQAGMQGEFVDIKGFGGDFEL